MLRRNVFEKRAIPVRFASAAPSEEERFVGGGQSFCGWVVDVYSEIGTGGE